MHDKVLSVPGEVEMFILTDLFIFKNHLLCYRRMDQKQMKLYYEVLNKEAKAGPQTSALGF